MACLNCANCAVLLAKCTHDVSADAFALDGHATRTEATRSELPRECEAKREK
jgi:hypothetical protein